MSPRNDILDRRILSLSEKDHLTLRALIEGGTLITGRLGSGKSSTSGRALAQGFLRAGLGGLILTVKSDEPDRWVAYAKDTGRSGDLVLFNAASGHTFDPLAYCWTRPGNKGGAYLETIIELFTTLLGIGKQAVKASSEGRYFELAVEELMRAVLVLLLLAGEEMSIVSIHNIITSLPIRPDQIEQADWQTSAAGRLVSKIKERIHTFTPSQREDLENAVHFTLYTWPNEDPRTRSNVLSTWSGMASKFIYDPLRSLFCSGKFSFTPEQTTHEHKIVVVAIPVLEHGMQASRLAQVLVKLVFQRAWLRHQYVPGCCHGAFLFQDEFPFLMHKHENYFHSVCRSSAIAAVCLTPNICNIAADEFGETTPGSRTKGFLGNLSVKIFHSQTDTETCQYAADLIGKEYRYLDSYHAGAGNGQMHTNVGGTQHLAHILEPVELTRLLSPDGDNPYAEAIVHVGGTTFKSTQTERNPKGQNYLRVFFSRDL
jgi:hypothetical protein